MCVKFSNSKHWYGVTRHLLAYYNISVHFIDSHRSYISAYRYLKNEDIEILHSLGHPKVLQTLKSSKRKHINKSNYKLANKEWNSS